MTGRTDTQPTPRPAPAPARVPAPRVRAARHLRRPLAALLAVCTLVVLALGAPPQVREAAAAEGPTATVSDQEAGAGGTVTVSGRGWRPRALLMMLICGQNMIGGTNSCANSDGRAVTTDAQGAFRKKLPVAEPPKPCPCVVHVATVTGEAAYDDVPFRVAGHPVAPLPKQEGTGGERLRALSARLDGSSGLLTWFGAPPQRRLVVTVANLGSTPARDPVFRVGTSHGVFAPSWEEQQWRGTIAAGKKAQVKLPVELSAGAHGDYRVSLRYGRKVLVEEAWTVGRPWGVTLFWILLCVVVPAAVFRIGMAVVDKVRPRTAAVAARGGDDGGALPWFTPDTLPQAQSTQTQHLSAPSQENRPTPKGST
ncbi:MULTISPECIES: hypothetical protein [unclassified Streptomyces]|uniref:hypothetical protein n=1 Tax=unclassified Streptomyces TaxID=2593676 RepID=UPI00336AAF48